MRRLSLLVVVLFTLVGLVAMGGFTRSSAQEATPADGEEGLTYQPLAFGTMDGSDLSLFRVTFEPGAGFPVEASDPSGGLVYVESGALTLQVEAPVTVTRAAAMEAAMTAEEDVLPATEEIAAGTEFQLATGDSALVPPLTAAELRNDGTEPAVVLGSLIAPSQTEATPEASPVN